jgi:hypothetical protein
MSSSTFRSRVPSTQFSCITDLQLINCNITDKDMQRKVVDALSQLSSLTVIRAHASFTGVSVGKVWPLSAMQQ